LGVRLPSACNFRARAVFGLPMADAGAVAGGGWSWPGLEADEVSGHPAEAPARAGPTAAESIEEAFALFVRSWQDLVYATALRLLANPAEAEDVAQTVFLRAFQHFDAVGASPAAAGWLRTVTRHACLNHLSRYRSRWRFFSELRSRDDDEGPAFEDTIAGGETADLAAEHADRREWLGRALQALPVHQRVPLVLFHFEDATYQEIAVALGVSVAKVKTDMHRGRLALRRSLGRIDGPC
jgi:RNA polymerase sigma-70 factor, ECF subfamily